MPGVHGVAAEGWTGLMVYSVVSPGGSGPTVECSGHSSPGMDVGMRFVLGTLGRPFALALCLP